LETAGSIYIYILRIHLSDLTEIQHYIDHGQMM